jgi:hypothetical protein
MGKVAEDGERDVEEDGCVSFGQRTDVPSWTGVVLGVVAGRSAAR